jgi:hypothetical protein
MLADRDSGTNYCTKIYRSFQQGVDYVGNLDQFAKEFEEDVS